MYILQNGNNQSANNHSTKVSNIQINPGQIRKLARPDITSSAKKKFTLKQRDLEIRTTGFAFTDRLS